MKKTLPIGKTLAVMAIAVCGLTSCNISKLQVNSVAYQSIINSREDLQADIPEDAKIATFYHINTDGVMTVWVKNLTDRMMVIDQTKSFFINANGVSTSYYDPTIRTSTTTNISSGTKGMSVNLGSVAKAAGVGGRVGSLLSGLNVGGSSTSGTVTSNTDFITDQPKVNIGPHGEILMNKQFKVSGVGQEALINQQNVKRLELTPKSSNCTFGVTITYSVDDEETYSQFTSEFFVNSILKVPVQKEGKKYLVNDALCKIYSDKPNALAEPWFLLYFDYSKKISGYKSYYNDTLYDYQ